MREFMRKIWKSGMKQRGATWQQFRDMVRSGKIKLVIRKRGEVQDA